MYDVDGNEFFDAASGSGSLILGHGDHELVEILRDQALQLTVFPGRLFACDIVERYAARLVSFAPDGVSQVVMYSSGSDAVEAAIKLAIQYQRVAGRPRKTKIIGREASYHGNTLCGLSAGGFVSRRKPYESVLPPVAKAAAAFCPSCKFELEPETCNVECALSLERAIWDEDPDTVAAFLVEPIVGAALSGATPDDRYLAAVREICTRNDVLLIADEVMTGFGRTGKAFAVEHWGVEPDIVVVGKAISAGYYPLSAVLVGERTAYVLERNGVAFQNGQTHACSPLACAIGAHVLDRIESEGLVANAGTRGTELIVGLGARLAGSKFATVRGKGLMVGLDFGRAAQGTLAFGLSERFQAAALRHGVLVYPSAGGALSEAGAHALVLPPLNIDRKDVAFLVDALASSVAETSMTAAP